MLFSMFMFSIMLSPESGKNANAPHAPRHQQVALGARLSLQSFLIRIGSRRRSLRIASSKQNIVLTNVLRNHCEILFQDSLPLSLPLSACVWVL